MTKNVLRCALSAMLLALSVPAEAQQPQNIPRIGYLSTRSAEMEQILLPVFLQGLRELGYTEGKNIVIEQRYAAAGQGVPAVTGQQERIRELVAELVRLKVDVIVASQTEVIAAAKEATTTIPIALCGWGPQFGELAWGHPGNAWYVCAAHRRHIEFDHDWGKPVDVIGGSRHR